MSGASRDTAPLSDFLGPRHWPTWLGLGLMRLIALLPFRAQLGLGTALGELMYRLAGKRRTIAKINVDLCFPDWSEAERWRLVRRNFHSTGISVAETALTWWGSAARLRRLYTTDGFEHYRDARATGKGVLLVGGHYTTIEISGRLMALEDALYPVYKPARNPLFDAVMHRRRARYYAGVLDNADLRTIVRTLRAGEVVWYAPDQDFGRERSVFAPFFGVPTATLTTTARLTRLSGATALHFSSERLPRARGYVLRITPFPDGYPSGDDRRDAAAVNAAIEREVVHMPAQYLWLHKRFKTRPEGEPGLYP